MVANMQKPKAIIYDSSAIISSRFLLNDIGLINILKDNSVYLKVQFMTPQVVVDEVLNKLREEIQKTNLAYSKIITSTKRFLLLTEIDDEYFRNELISKNKKEIALKNLEILINEIGGVLPYPDVEHSAIVKRALERRRPFDTEGHKGYRDTIIWESILSLVRAELIDTDIIFVCQNPRDFNDKEKWKKGNTVLNTHLVDDLKELKYSAKRFRCYTSLNQFCENEIYPYLEDLKGLETSVSNKSFLKDLNKVLSTSLLEECDIAQEIEYEFDSIEYIYVEITEIKEILRSKKMPPNIALIQIACEISYRVDLYIFKMDYYGYLLATLNY